MSTQVQAPMRTGLLEFLRKSNGCQFTIPVYQRNYTWTKNKEVKQYLLDLEQILNNTYQNHFLGIMIYLDKSIDFANREFSVIDGQQRLTTTFLILYAIRSLFKENNNIKQVIQLDEYFLTNKANKDDPQYYKLKPLFSDDNVYQKIINEDLEHIDNTQSKIYENYIYIKKLISAWTKKYTLNEILMALNKLYIVCIPLNEEDNAQKIFESINATGKKLTASDLIRNFMLMNLSSDIQDKFYIKYWKKYEQLVSSNANKLEDFFRFFISIKELILIPKNAVYSNFVKWKQEYTNISNPENIFKEIEQYAVAYNIIYIQNLDNIDKELRYPISEFREIQSFMPAPLLMELVRIYKFKSEYISKFQLKEIITILCSYLQRRALCNFDTSDITKLFIPLLKVLLFEIKNNNLNLLETFKLKLINENKNNSMRMPTDSEIEQTVLHTNMYVKDATRIFFNKLELTNNSAPVNLKTLTIEHLMPQKPTNQWLEELDISEDEYYANLNRLGNLTLASKIDNSKMSNNIWEYKNTILKSTNHLRINEYLFNIKKWDISEINKRTQYLIDKIKILYPYTPADEKRIPIHIYKNQTKIDAYLYLSDGRVEIISNSYSIIPPRISKTSLEYLPQYKKLIQNNTIEESNNIFKFKTNYTFYPRYNKHTALSSSASFILGSSRNGWNEWYTNKHIPINEVTRLKEIFK